MPARKGRRQAAFDKWFLGSVCILASVLCKLHIVYNCSAPVEVFELSCCTIVYRSWYWLELSAFCKKLLGLGTIFQSAEGLGVGRHLFWDCRRPLIRILQRLEP